MPTWTEKRRFIPITHVQVARALYSGTDALSSAGPCACAPTGAPSASISGTELVKAHPRVAARQSVPTDGLRLHPRARQRTRSAASEALLAQAKARGAHVGLYAEKLLGGPLPWTRMRQAYGLHSTVRRYLRGRACVEAVCQSSALAFRRRRRLAHRSHAQGSAAVPKHTRSSRWQGLGVDRDARGSRGPLSISRRARHRRRRKVRDGCADHLARPRRRPQATEARSHRRYALRPNSCSPRSRTCRSRICSSSCSPTKSRAARQQRLIIVRAKLRLDPSMRLEQWDKTAKVSFDEADARRAREPSLPRDTPTLRRGARGRGVRQDLPRERAWTHRMQTRIPRPLPARRRHAPRTLRQSRLDNSRDAEMIALTTMPIPPHPRRLRARADEQGGEQGRVPTLPRAHRSRVDDRDEQPRHGRVARDVRRRAPRAERRRRRRFQRTPPTTSSSRASPTDHDSSRSSMSRERRRLRRLRSPRPHPRARRR